MTGSETAGNSMCSVGRRPNSLQLQQGGKQQGGKCEQVLSDQLRRKAIKNSFQTKISSPSSPSSPKPDKASSEDKQMLLPSITVSNTEEAELDKFPAFTLKTVKSAHNSRSPPQSTITPQDHHHHHLPPLRRTSSNFGVCSAHLVPTSTMCDSSSSYVYHCPRSLARRNHCSRTANHLRVAQETFPSSSSSSSSVCCEEMCDSDDDNDTQSMIEPGFARNNVRKPAFQRAQFGYGSFRVSGCNGSRVSTMPRSGSVCHNYSHSHLLLEEQQQHATTGRYAQNNKARQEDCHLLQHQGTTRHPYESANFERQAPAGPYSYVSLHRAQSNTAPMHPASNESTTSRHIITMPTSNHKRQLYVPQGRKTASLV